MTQFMHYLTLLEILFDWHQDSFPLEIYPWSLGLELGLQLGLECPEGSI